MDRDKKTQNNDRTFEELTRMHVSRKYSRQRVIYKTNKNVVQEVGDESKLAQSFERIRDLVRKRRQQRMQEQKQNENNSRLEQIVREVMQRRAEEEAFKTGT